MSHRTTRRQLLKATAAVGAGLLLPGPRAFADAESSKPVPPSERLNIGMIGCAHRAEANLNDLALLKNINIVSLCDIDDNYFAAPLRRFPHAKTYNDFRVMLDEQKNLDAVLVATPNHTHAIATMSAMNAGKHVYCEKPLTHTLWEARTVTQTAAKLKRVTQMGTQIHATKNYRRTVELIQSGAIGLVREVHAFCQKSHSAKEDVVGSSPVPQNLHYDLWIGPSAFRPYNPAYLPETWRRYWNFGEGTLGDMGCHYIDLVYWALNLKYPTRVSAEGPPPHPENCPTELTVHWEFPARGEQPPVKLSWYDGGRMPAAAMEWKLDPKWKNGVLFIGDKGALFADYDHRILLPEKDFADFTPPKTSIPDSIGHHKEWVEACLRNDPSAPLCRFDYSGPLAETVLLGAVAFRLGKTLDWDAENLRATNAPEANALIRTQYREGWYL